MRVKICCIQDEEELSIAVLEGADAIGLVGQMPNGPGPIPDATIHRLSRSVPPGVSTFLLTSETSANDIIAHHHLTQTDTIQLVDYVDPVVYHTIRRQRPVVRIVQVIHVTGPESLAMASEVAPLVDAILLDSGNPGGHEKTLGGTGNVHDWDISRNIVDSIDIPVFLAGGLNPSNVDEAIRTVRPYGVDVCSGLRTTGRLDREKVTAFMRNARGWK